MAGKRDGRQLRWDSHNAARRQHILDAAIAVLEAGEPGSEVHVQQIADRAGLSRTVVYRHFADRADLDAAVQGRALELLRAELVPSLGFEGTPVEIIRRIVSAYVGWASEHPSLHEFAQQDARGPGVGQMEQAIQQIAGQIEDLINVGVQVLHVELGDEEVAALDPLVFGLVGAVFTATRRWLSRLEQRPSREAFVALVTEAVWLQIAGLARQRGVELDPDVPVEQLLDGAIDAAMDTAMDTAFDGELGAFDGAPS
jgi:AcrR family transcriptional regulator